MLTSFFHYYEKKLPVASACLYESNNLKTVAHIIRCSSIRSKNLEEGSSVYCTTLCCSLDHTWVTDAIRSNSCKRTSLPDNITDKRNVFVLFHNISSRLLKQVGLTCTQVLIFFRFYLCVVYTKTNFKCWFLRDVVSISAFLHHGTRNGNCRRKWDILQN